MWTTRSAVLYVREDRLFATTADEVAGALINVLSE
jgi:hypothetical protein